MKKKPLVRKIKTESIILTLFTAIAIALLSLASESIFYRALHLVLLGALPSEIIFLLYAAVILYPIYHPFALRRSAFLGTLPIRLPFTVPSPSIQYTDRFSCLRCPILLASLTFAEVIKLLRLRVYYLRWACYFYLSCFCWLKAHHHYHLPKL